MPSPCGWASSNQWASEQNKASKRDPFRPTALSWDTGLSGLRNLTEMSALLRVQARCPQTLGFTTSRVTQSDSFQQISFHLFTHKCVRRAHVWICTYAHTRVRTDSKMLAAPTLSISGDCEVLPVPSALAPTDCGTSNGPLSHTPEVDPGPGTSWLRVQVRVCMCVCAHTRVCTHTLVVLLLWETLIQLVSS